MTALGTAPTYAPRLVDRELDELCASLPAVAVEGPKGVGKTATAERRVQTIVRLDDLAQQKVAVADPTVLLNAPRPILLDEWQHVPVIWDAVRRAVDGGAKPGSFLLAGSAAPATPPTHSGAGRIVRVRMRPLSLAERGIDKPTVSLGAILKGAKTTLRGHASTTLSSYTAEILASGFPGLRRLHGRALRAQLDGYLARIVDRDFAEQGRAVRKPDTLRRWMEAYAAATATTTSFEKIRRAASHDDGELAAINTAKGYRDILERLWILDPVPGWTPSRNALSRLTQLPRHHLADPALAARLLGVDETALQANGQLLGQLFESLVTLSVRVYAQHAEARVLHVRDQEGRHEVDLIVERADRRILAIEVKLASDVDDHDVRHLHWLKEKVGSAMLDAMMITTGSHAYRRTDGIAVVPASLLTA